jgi:Icc-related predicted phosphoesterase
MKILSLSDEVHDAIYSPQVQSTYGDVDLVLSCGDLPMYYLEYVVTMLNVPLFYVHGNHAPPVTHTFGGHIKPIAQGCIDLDNRVVRYKGLLVGGLEGSIRYKPQGDFQYTETQMWIKALTMAPILMLNRLRWGRYLDILITHAPPRGIHDGPDLCHTGFTSLLWLMQRFRPRYLIHGHVHGYRWRAPKVSQHKATTVINAHPYYLLEFNEREL